MLKLNVFLVVCMLMYYVCVAVADDPESCTVGDKIIAVGESYKPEGKCEQITCGPRNSMVGKGCGLLNFDPTTQKCTVIPEDVSKPYPECCETIKCED